MKDWFFYSTLAIVAWGIWAFLPKLAVTWLDPKSALIYEAVGGIITGLIAFCMIGSNIGTDLRGVVPAILTGVAGYAGLICFMLALRTGKVSVVAPLTALYPVISVVLALVFFREKLNLVQLAGVALAVVSVILISQE